MDLAKRAFDHGFRLDPIVRSLLDTDFYKLLMLQMIWREHRDTPVVFQVINRTRSVRMADEIDVAALRDQLDHARTLRFTNKELVWLAGNSFYGVKQIFSPDFIAWLTDYRLPDYDLSVQDGQYVLTFSGAWAEVTCGKSPPWPSSMNCAAAQGCVGWDGSNWTSSIRGPRPGCGPRSSGCAPCPIWPCPTSAPVVATASCGNAGAFRP